AFAMADLANGGQSLFVKLFGSLVVAPKPGAFTEVAQHSRAITTIAEVLVQAQALFEEQVGFGKTAELQMSDAQQLEAGGETGAIAEFNTKGASLFAKSYDSGGITETIESPTFQQ